MPTHSETRQLPYTADQMYALVADISAYPAFLPWCSAARIRTRDTTSDHDILAADLMISFKVFREHFASRVELWHLAKRIETCYLDGPFKHMNSTWQFVDTKNGCEVDFFVDFEFQNVILQGIIGVVFNEAMQHVVRAFENRASALYSTK